MNRANVIPLQNVYKTVALLYSTSYILVCSMQKSNSVHIDQHQIGWNCEAFFSMCKCNPTQWTRADTDTHPQGRHQGKLLEGWRALEGPGGRAPSPPEAEAFLVLKSW